MNELSNQESKETFNQKSPPSVSASEISFERLLSQAYQKIEEKSYREARRLFQQILKEFPDLKKNEKGRILGLSGKMSYWLGEYFVAKQDLNLALQLNPRNDIANLYLGKIALSEYFFTKAKGYFMSIKRPNAEADLALCRLYIRLRDLPQATQALRQASHSMPASHPEYRLMHAYISLLSGDHASSVRDALNLVKELEHDPDALIILAELLVTAGNYKEAKAILDTLVSLLPGNDQIYGLFAQCSYAAEDYEGALRNAGQALSLNPFNAFAMTVHLKVACRRGEYQTAEALGHRILEQSPEYTLGHTNLGDVYFLQGRYDLARQEYLDANEYMDTKTRGSQLRQARLAFIDKDFSKAKSILEPLTFAQGLYYDDALCDLLMVYDLLEEREKKQDLMDRMEIRKSYSYRIDEMLKRMAA